MEHVSFLEIVLSLFVRNFWFIEVRGELRICGTSKMSLFTKIVYHVKPLRIFIRGSILRAITYGVPNLPWVFFADLQFLYWFVLLTLWLYTFFLVYIVCILVYMCLDNSFRFSSFSHGMKLKFVAPRTLWNNDDWWR